VSAADYPKLYRTADAFVLPTHAESWGRQLAEAMFMGLPTIATAWSGQLEFMRDDNSFLVPHRGLEPAFPKEIPALLDAGMYSLFSLPLDFPHFVCQ